MPAWASDPSQLWKGALWGAFFLWATPAWSEVDLTGLWQNTRLPGPSCQATAETFTDQGGILTITGPADSLWPEVSQSWRHGDWSNGQLDLTPIGEDVLPTTVVETPEGLVFCPRDRRLPCQQFRRCTPGS